MSNSVWSREDGLRNQRHHMSAEKSRAAGEKNSGKIHHLSPSAL